MNVVGVNLLIASVNVVTTNNQFCPMCTCDPCNCEWSDNEQFEEGDVDIVQVDAQQCDGDDGSCALPSITDFRSSIFDCLSDFSGYPRDSEIRQRNSNIINRIPTLKVGDLVKWYPVHGFNRPRHVWIVKRVLNPNLYDSGWFDYEITDGAENYLVTKYELFKVRAQDDKQ